MLAILKLMRKGFLNLADLGEFTAAAVENDTISFIASYRDGKVFTCNLAFCSLTGYSKDEISELKWPQDFTTAEYRDRAVEIVKGINCDVAPCMHEMEFVRKDKTIVPVDLFAHKFYNDAGTALYFYSFITDMTEHKRLENALRTSEAKYRELVENANSIILKMDSEGNVTFFNEFAQRFFRFSKDEILGKNVIGTIVPKTESSGRDLSNLIKEIFNNPEHFVNNENENMRGNGERVWVSWTNKAIMDNKGNLIGILSVGNDITAIKLTETELKRSRDELEIRVKERTAELEKMNQFLLNEIEARKRAEKDIIESEEKFKVLAENSQAIILLHQGGKLVYTNPAFEAATGYLKKEISDMDFWYFFAPDNRELVKARGLARLRGDKVLQRYEVKITTKQGDERWWDLVSSYMLEYQGKPTVISTAMDITERKATENVVLSSLKEKEVLLKEIHHRVKNNLQIISSLLSLQSGYIRHSEDVAIFKESKDRIKTMALIHEKLYQSRDFTRVDFIEYVNSLAGNLVINYGMSDRVRCVVRGDQANLTIDEAVPCGLIVNELVTNSLKYAFPGDGRGEIVIDIRRNNGQLSLTLSDNGVGLPRDFEIGKSKTLGLQLVEQLTKQLEGTLEVLQGTGTSYHITFKINDSN